jgi:hypothetical protein
MKLITLELAHGSGLVKDYRMFAGELRTVSLNVLKRSHR